jgi:heme exporter protein D
MNLDLGKYGGEVIGSYIASLALIGILVALSLYRNTKMKRALAEVEARAKK